MKKFFLCILVLSILGAGTVFAQSVVADDSFASIGSWRAAGGTWRADGRLTQADAQAPIAQIVRQLPQSGVYEVEFTITYAAGGYRSEQDARRDIYRAGFGLHIGIDRPSGVLSWGNGNSYLLWVNLDTEVPRTSRHYGLRGQIYRSRTDTDMTLMDDFNVEILPLAQALDTVGGMLNQAVPVRLRINTNDGEVRVYDPTDPGYYYYFYLEPRLLRGSWISLRTSKFSAAFRDFRVVQER